jgi:glycosyltransferase involved in cell wall biosynthesis
MTSDCLPEHTRRASVLWILSNHAEPNGATLRYVNYAKWLRRANYRVHFAVSDSTYDEDRLKGLLEERCIDSFSRLRVPQREKTIRLLHTLAAEANPSIMAAEKSRPSQELRELIARIGASVCVISDRAFLPDVPWLSDTIRTVIDWGDSGCLFYRRALWHSLKSFAWSELVDELRFGFGSFCDERWYPSIAQANVVVSPIDEAEIRHICPAPNGLKAVLNGVEVEDLDVLVSAPTKVESRLVFSGRMDFKPNFQGAIWFIDKVLPLVRERNPKAHIVIAGSNPIAELKNRECDGVQITGYVPDLRRELAQAQLFVAPLISGGGFKNKVLEAIAAGTPVVGTALATEFLPQEISRAVLTADNASEFAQLISRSLTQRDLLNDQVAEARKFLRSNFSWQKRTQELMTVLNPQ